MPGGEPQSRRLYSPPPDGDVWETTTPQQAGFDPDRLENALRAVRASETTWPVDLRAHLDAGFFDPPPFNEIIGPIEPRGPPNGMLLHAGRILARWGDTRHVDMIFSVAKSYLSMLAGVAVADGILTDLDEPVGRTVRDGGFASEQNASITWRHLLQQTSEWEGTLWGKSEQIDRNRIVAREGQSDGKGERRPLNKPGEFWEYNDVRVNRFSFSLMQRFKRPLPEVFAERIMRPIGASETWRWEGYRNSFAEIDGQRLQSVPGGGHWGGGVFMHAEDQARIALLGLRQGTWNGRQIVPQPYMAASVEPCRLNPLYGLMWWLNTGQARFAAASPESHFMLGSGGNVVWLDPASDLVAVFRWTDSDRLNGIMTQILDARLSPESRPDTQR